MDDTENRKKSLEELQKLMREQRARLDPAVLKRAEAAALLSQKIPKAAIPPQKPDSRPKPEEKPPAPSADTVDLTPKDLPYDRESAAKAIELFLKGHGNSRDFQIKLLEKLKKTDH